MPFPVTWRGFVEVLPEGGKPLTAEEVMTRLLVAVENSGYLTALATTRTLELRYDWRAFFGWRALFGWRTRHYPLEGILLSVIEGPNGAVVAYELNVLVAFVGVLVGLGALSLFFASDLTSAIELLAAVALLVIFAFSIYLFDVVSSVRGFIRVALRNAAHGPEMSIWDVH